MGLVVVARIDNHHVRQHLHQSEVFHHLVGGTVFADGDASMGGGDFHVEVGIGDGHADLVIHAPGNETGECARKWDFPAQSQAGGNADHVGFRNARLYESVGKFLDEIAHFQAPNYIGA